MDCMHHFFFSYSFGENMVDMLYEYLKTEFLFTYAENYLLSHLISSHNHRMVEVGRVLWR